MMCRFSSATSSLLELIKKVKLVAFDFDGVFTDNMVYVLQGGTEAVRCSRSDGLGLRKLAAVGVGAVVVSTETNSVVVERSKKLKIECFNGCEDKLAVLKAIAADKRIFLGEIAFVGNDINDSECLGEVGLPIVVQDAHPDVLKLGVYRTNSLGGHGAVREVCDMIAYYRSVGLPDK